MLQFCSTSDSSTTVRISVVIPLFNRESTIGRCLKSVISQTVLPSEIIVVDDGSTDSSVRIVQEIIKNDVCMVLLVKNRFSKGANGARNTGIITSSSEWIMFLDSDDFWSLDKVREVGKLIGFSSPLNEFVVVDSPSRKLVELSKERVLFQEVFPCYNIYGGFSKITARRSIFNEIGMLDESLMARQDLDFFIRLQGYSEVAIIQKQLTVIDDSGEDRITRNIDGKISSIQALVKKHYNSYSNTQKLLLQLHVMSLHIHYKKIRAIFIPILISRFLLSRGNHLKAIRTYYYYTHIEIK